MRTNAITSIIILLLILGSNPSYGQMSAQWYKDNQQAINQHRKGDFQIQVLDESGARVETEVSYKLVKHEFPWGTALNFGSDTNEDWYRAIARAYFNAGVMENDFKWSSMEPVKGQVNYTTVNNYLGWAQEVGWEFRGHTLLWGSKDYDDFHPLMKWVKDLTVPNQIAECKKRVDREMTYFKGKIKEYDVMNEAISGHADYLQQTVGDSINWNCFKWARAADPDAKLYINDYNVVAYNDTYRYNDLIEKIINNGGPIDGIGVQGHFGSNLSPYTIKSKLNTLSKHGLPIKVTEFDMQVGSSNMSEAKQADYYAQAMRACFAHPNVNGFMFWGFWDNRHWRDKAGLFYDDKTPKIAADSVYTLIHEKWSSKGMFAADVNANAALNVYYGTYEFEIVVDGKPMVLSALLGKEHVDSIITLQLSDAKLKSPTLFKVRAIDGQNLRLYFDDKVEVTRRQHSSFKIYSDNKRTTLLASQPEEDSTIVQIRLKDKVDNAAVLTAFYGSNNLFGKNGAPLQFVKPLSVEMNIGEFVSAKTSNGGDSLIIAYSEPLDTTTIDNSSVFEVSIDGNPVIPIELTFNSKYENCVVLKLAENVTPGAKVSVNYLSSKIYTIYGGKVLGFTSREVNNNVATSISEVELESVDMKYSVLNASLEFKNNTSRQLSYSIYNLKGHVIVTGTLAVNESKSQSLYNVKNTNCLVVVRGSKGFKKVKRFIIQ